MIAPRQHAYKFSTHSPHPLRMEAGELPENGHRMKWIARKDMFAAPGKNMAYHCRCICKWKDKDESGEDKYVPKRLLIARYAHHILEVRSRGVSRGKLI